jgi:hypothetical protein
MIDTSVAQVHQHGACVADNESAPWLTYQGIKRPRQKVTSWPFFWLTVSLSFGSHHRKNIPAFANGLSKQPRVAAEPCPEKS